MKYKLYFIASFIFVVLGIGHIVAEFISRLFFNPQNNPVYREMSRYYVHVFGFSRSIEEFMHGFSITMGFMMTVFGVLNLVLLKKAKEVVLGSSLINVLNAMVALGLVILSVLYFHWPPIILYSVSCLCFFRCLFIKNVKEA